MNNIKRQRAWVWSFILILLLIGCTNLKNPLSPKVISTPTNTEIPLSVTPSQSAQITALPQGLILVQVCNKQDKPCPDSVLFNDSNGNYRQFSFVGFNLNLAHDYKKSTFENAGDIWLFDLASGKSENLTNTIDCNEHDITWSPDSKSIAFLGCGGDYVDDIYLLDITSGKRTDITNTPDRYERCFSSTSDPLSNCSLGWWSQQPSFIVAGSGKPKQSRPGEIMQGDCHTYGGECNAFPTKISINSKDYGILDQINGLEHQPALSPDGKLLAYDGGILYNLETDKQETIYPSKYGLHVEASNTSGDPQLVSPSWSPDGKQIAWIGHLNEHGDNGLFVFDISHHEGQILQTYRPSYVTLMLPAWQRWSNSSVRWSPDSQWLTLSDSEWDKQKSTYGAFLLVISRDGKTKVKFDAGNYIYGSPIWSPDSTKIVFSQNYFATSGFPEKIKILEINDWQVKQLNVPKDTYPVAWFKP
jgi:Tol biopolymer transport system component